MDRTDRSTLRELRRRRRDRRLGDVEWFDVAYRAYLYALGGTALVIWASDLIEGVVDDVGRADLLARGPGVAGVLVAIAVAFGLRNGAEGGPVSIEPADVRHLLLSPVGRGVALLAPTTQRLRSVAFAAVVPAAIIGQLIGREVVGSRAAWAGAFGLFAAATGLVLVAVAVLAHAVRLPRPVATTVGVVLVTWQLGSAVATWQAGADGRSPGAAGAGPFDLLGSVSLWGVRQRPADALALGVVVVVVGAALALCGRLRIEQLQRRGRLVSQLRFAATMRDIRTVVQLRRQLAADVVRAQPWRWTRRRRRTPRLPAAVRPTTRPRAGAAPGHVPAGLVLRRGVASLRRFPPARIVRIVVLAAVAGAAAHGAVAWSPICLVGVVLPLYLLGLEIVEPLAQEVDHPDRTDALPIDRSRLFALHLVVPAIALVPVALLGAAVVSILEPASAPAAFAVALPVTWAGAIGSVVTTIGDAPRPAGIRDTTILGAERVNEHPFAMPEFAGVGSLVSSLVPLVCSAVAAVPILAIDAAPDAGTALRAAVGVALCLAVLVWWTLRRDRWATNIRDFFAAGRAAQEAR